MLSESEPVPAASQDETKVLPDNSTDIPEGDEKGNGDSVETTTATTTTSSQDDDETKKDDPEKDSQQGVKRSADEEEDNNGKTDETSVAASGATTTSSSTTTEPVVKKAKIAMPPAIAPSLMDVEEYTLEYDDDNDENSAAVEDQKKKSADEVGTKIVYPALMLFGLHPLIKEQPLRKTLERYGTVESLTVRSAFASRYGHVTYNTLEEAHTAYVALNGFKIFHKKLLIQPGQQPAQQQKQE